MTTDQETIARKAIESPHWDWCYGMLALFPPTAKEPDGYRVRIADDTDCRNARIDCAIPDISDVATLGCIFALARKAWQDDYLIFRGYPPTDTLPPLWRRLHAGNRVMAEGGEHTTEAAAIVGALLDAPARAASKGAE